jgi:hypothetical protein
MFKPAASNVFNRMQLPFLECWMQRFSELPRCKSLCNSHYATIKAPGPSDLLALAQLADSYPLADRKALPNVVYVWLLEPLRFETGCRWNSYLMVGYRLWVVCYRIVAWCKFHCRHPACERYVMIVWSASVQLQFCGTQPSSNYFPFLIC